MPLPTVISLVQTCGACPSQWDGVLDDGRAIYVRYRWGWLSVRVSTKEDAQEEFGAVRGEEIFGEQLGDNWDGVLTTTELINHTSHVLDWIVIDGDTIEFKYD